MEAQDPVGFMDAPTDTSSGLPVPPAATDPMSYMAPDPVGVIGAPLPTDPTPPVGGGAAYVDPFQGVPVPSKDTSMGASVKIIPEMSALREWEDKHERQLEEKARKEEEEKKDRKKSAAEELAKFYEDSDANKKKRQQTNRAAEDEASEHLKAESPKPGSNTWERFVDLIDTKARASDESRDTSRMRSILIQLKSSPIVA